MSARNRIRDPRSLGLVGYDEYRPAQHTALEQLLESNKRWLVLEGPTGSGKTLIAAAYQRHIGDRMIYTCSTKTLQDQFIQDFPDAALIKGRANYPCNLHPDTSEVTAADCVAIDMEPNERSRCKASCTYESTLVHARHADLAVLNTSKLLADCKYAGNFSDWPLITLDEADLLESTLMGVVELRVPQYAIRRFGLSAPKLKTKQEAWEPWAEETLSILDGAIGEAANEIARHKHSYGIQNLKLIDLKRSFSRIVALHQRLELFLESLADTAWVNCTVKTDNLTGPWLFRPVMVQRFAEDHLWRHANRFLLMSATVIAPNLFAKTIGIERSEMEFIQMPSTFPVERRPILYRPVVAMTYKTRDKAWPQMAAGIDDLIAKFPGKRILVHTHSYVLASYLYEQSVHSDRMVRYQGSSERDDALEQFRGTPGAVLVAPSLERGIDLPHEECDVIIVAKVPYPSLADKQVSARLHGTSDGQDWYAVETIRALVQSTGRAMRSANDFCISYILDRQFEQLRQEIFPAWWREALV